jgi:outer membrane biosynthesis protein TonB
MTNEMSIEDACSVNIVEKRPTNEEIEKYNNEKEEKEKKEKEEKEKVEKQKAEDEKKAKQESKGEQDQTEIVNRMNSMELRRISEDQADNEGDGVQLNRSSFSRANEENKVGRTLTRLLIIYRKLLTIKKMKDKSICR